MSTKKPKCLFYVTFSTSTQVFNFLVSTKIGQYQRKKQQKLPFNIIMIPEYTPKRVELPENYPHMNRSLVRLQTSTQNR